MLFGKLKMGRSENNPITSHHSVVYSDDIYLFDKDIVHSLIVFPLIAKKEKHCIPGLFDIPFTQGPIMGH